ncbi:MAG: histidine triad nucleotide-binding protein [Chloroflexota bacterium]
MRDPNCLFCKILDGEIPSDQVYQDDLVTAFRDINPVAPTHILIIPNKHIANNNKFTAEDETYGGRLFSAVRELAQQEGIADSGYRLIMNSGKDGHQEVFHLHMHLIGGQPMQHKMG